MHMNNMKLHNKQAQQPVHRQKFNKISSVWRLNDSKTAHWRNERENERKNTAIGLSETAASCKAMIAVVVVV